MTDGRRFSDASTRWGWRMDRLVRGFVLGTLAAATLSLQAAAAPAELSRLSREDSWRYCTDAAAQIERKDQLPQSILEAITTVETGRGVPGEAIRRPWPWTVTAEGKGHHYATKSAAIEAVRALRARGVSSIDVGCMQVNLHYHPGAFTSLEEAFDPASNITYAASLLTQLRQGRGSWESAIEHYHSYDPDRRLAYRLRVFASWQSINADRESFRLASEIAPERLGAPGEAVRLSDRAVSASIPLTGALIARHRGPSVLQGPVVRLTNLDPPSRVESAEPAPLVVIAVDLRPRDSDRPDPSEASVLGRTTVAVADPAGQPIHD